MTEKLIERIYWAVYKKVFNKSRSAKLSKGDRTDILSAISKLEASEKYNEFAEKYAEALSKAGIRKQRGVWRNFYRVARKLHLGALPSTYTEYEKKVFAKAITQNFTMIKSIPREMLNILNHKYTSVLIKSVAEGKLPRGSFEKELKKHGAKNAKLIARTESAKLTTVIQKERAVQLGSVAYVWRSSNDRRTRPSHREMNDVVVFYRDLEKPLRDGMRGDAGEFPNCRCDTRPIIDFDLLTKPFYKVYDYNTDKIISMGRKILIEKLKNGKL